ncbi:MAG: hypothetical protein COW65_15035 [Cytophagales bacterium CG18_big_fil_WC_8_21_14_2_50_42_9]|nr:MAG: hypothetical protein COW65_15035 [Cytophagales bacterium CG18_big_fil_WC_8_21_14_2_50_42_9]
MLIPTTCSMFRVKPFATLLFFLLITTGLFAQTKTATNATPADQQAIEKTVRTLFDSMRAADTAMARSVIAPNFRIVVLVQNPAQQTGTRETTRKQFLHQIASKSPQTLDERYWAGQVQIDGDLASFWCQYAFFNAGKFSHCGTDVFQLYRSPQGWKIVNLAYNIQREGCDMKAIPAK